ncbi:hypothetical protein AOQ84DRAFT_371263 [Glonium stellatum]|uniref:Apple domain-containing protein n=1 Tax=Glonium stellatum TaxID=574774 RepID=A0A8E2FDK5_9PEZI|nr:hypothetical protein AOQ84DRAFT_371263 [Glonium stellatum]
MRESNWTRRKTSSNLIFIALLFTSFASASPASTTTWTAPAPTSSALCPYNNNTIYTGPTDGQHYLVQCGVDRAGGDYTTSTTPQSLTDCINLCDQNPICVGAAWVHGGTCYLKSTHQTPSVNGNVDSADCIDCSPPSSTSTTSATATPTSIQCPAQNQTFYTNPYNGDVYRIDCGMDQDGAAISNPYTNDLNACIGTCSNTTGCLLVVWVLGSPQGPCYMKSTVGTSIVYDNSRYGAIKISSGWYTTSLSSSSASSSSSSISSGTLSSSPSSSLSSNSFSSSFSSSPSSSSSSLSSSSSISSSIIVSSSSTSFSTSTTLTPTSTSSASTPISSFINCPSYNGTIYTYMGVQYLITCYLDRFGHNEPGTPLYNASMEQCIAECAQYPGCIDVSWAPGPQPDPNQPPGQGPCYPKYAIGSPAVNPTIWDASVIIPMTSSSPSSASTSSSFIITPSSSSSSSLWTSSSSVISSSSSVMSPSSLGSYSSTSSSSWSSSSIIISSPTPTVSSSSSSSTASMSSPSAVTSSSPTMSTSSSSSSYVSTSLSSSSSSPIPTTMTSTSSSTVSQTSSSASSSSSVVSCCGTYDGAIYQSTNSTGGSPYFTVECYNDRDSNSFASYNLISFQQCMDYCAGNSQCADISYQFGPQACYLKQAVGLPSSDTSICGGLRSGNWSSSSSSASTSSFSSTAFSSISYTSNSLTSTSPSSSSAFSSSTATATSSSTSSSPNPSSCCGLVAGSTYSSGSGTYRIQCGSYSGDLLHSYLVTSFAMCSSACSTYPGCYEAAFVPATLLGTCSFYAYDPAAGTTNNSKACVGILIPPTITSSVSSTVLTSSVSTSLTSAASSYSTSSASSSSTSSSSTSSVNTPSTSGSLSTTLSSLSSSSFISSVSSPSVSGSSPVSPTGPGTSTLSSSTTSGPSVTLCPYLNETIYHPPGGGSCLIECGIDHAGGNINVNGSFSTPDLNGCIAGCQQQPGCVDVSFSTGPKICYMKYAIGTTSYNSGSVDGAICNFTFTTTTISTLSTAYSSSSSSSSSVTSSLSPTSTSPSSTSPTVNTAPTSTASSTVSSSSSTTTVTSSLTSSSSISSSPALTPSSSSSVTTSSTTSSSTSSPSAASCCGLVNGTISTAYPPSYFTVDCGTDHAGGDLQGYTNLTFTQCVETCSTNPACIDLTFTTSGGCYLKQAIGPVSYHNGFCGMIKILGPSSSSSSIPTTTTVATSSGSSSIFMISTSTSTSAAVSSSSAFTSMISISSTPSITSITPSTTSNGGSSGPSPTTTNGPTAYASTVYVTYTTIYPVTYTPPPATITATTVQVISGSIITQTLVTTAPGGTITQTYVTTVISTLVTYSARPPPPPPPSSSPISPNGSCGPPSGYTCSGSFGYDPITCGPGCNPAYGTCDRVHSISSSTTPISPTMSQSVCSKPQRTVTVTAWPEGAGLGPLQG